MSEADRTFTAFLAPDAQANDDQFMSQSSYQEKQQLVSLPRLV